MQWAADNIVYSSRMVPPQNVSGLLTIGLNWTCQGMGDSASFPPIILSVPWLDLGDLGNRLFIHEGIVAQEMLRFFLQQHFFL